eukprot:CAMPEP_0119358286 /NCGR_PEP_ID=MMETSP1334-20130426/6521_1 /TAXON_ID=127549 /ORGANISM="Calcidiscus leptoporus, Strain RCC1130" /LENGTH=89 /DNA_ID=CAMNT_0007372743 /DNA_START=385 /DNA_END=654 /DNA_ORIENTATION=-
MTEPHLRALHRRPFYWPMCWIIAAALPGSRWPRERTEARAHELHHTAPPQASSKGNEDGSQSGRARGREVASIVKLPLVGTITMRAPPN